jgi:hypothetical protein
MDVEVAKDGSQGSREEKEAERKEADRKIAKTKGRYGVCRWQERKGSRSFRRLPFMQKAVPLLRTAATGKKSNGCLHQAPSSHTK